MFRIVDRRRALLAVTIALAIVAVVVPTCRMIGCSMEMGAMGSMEMGHPGTGVGLFSSCGGTYAASMSLLAAIPVSLESLVMALFAVAVAFSALLAPRLVARPVAVANVTPSPPPEEPLGARLRL